jgi:large subunit ribosomal protein L18Ae
MAGRHRTRSRSIQIIRTAQVESKDLKRTNMLQFIKSDIKFPLPHRIMRSPSKSVRATFTANRPCTHFQ